jgi:lipopolysaccharide/colanic/teichoic acid biosynthesis glycosyltransferase
VTWIALLIAAVFVNFVLAEFFAWFPWMSRQIIRLGAKVLPDETRERYQAEWIAEAESLPGKGLSAVLFALSVLIKAPATRAAIRPNAPPLRITFSRRAFDFLFAFWVIVLSAPLFLVIAAMIRLTSRGPVFHYVTRRDPSGHEIRLLKFRVPAPGEASPRVAAAFAHFLRASALDELPQIIDLMKGDLSLVGPPPRHPLDPREADMLDTKPGLLSWTVVVGEDEGRERDAELARSWTLIGALRLLLRTIPALFKRRH